MEREMLVKLIALMDFCLRSLALRTIVRVVLDTLLAGMISANIAYALLHVRRWSAKYVPNLVSGGFSAGVMVLIAVITPINRPLLLIGLIFGLTPGIAVAFWMVRQEEVMIAGIRLASKDFVLPKNVVLSDNTFLKKGSAIFTWSDAMALENEGKLPRGYRLPTAEELKLLCREPICIGTTREFYKDTIKTGIYSSPMRYWGTGTDEACCLSFSYGGTPSFSSMQDASGYLGRIRLVRK